jgi:RND family efflux transporter MFP subunit
MKSQLALWKQILVIVVLFGVGYGVWHQRERVMQFTGISFGQETKREGRRGGGDNKVPVIVEQVTLTKAVDTIEAVGSGLANRSITIFPKVSGLITEIDFQAGRRVKQGDVILKLDDAQTQIAVRIAETKLAEAKRILERSVALLPRQAIAQATVDTARTAVKTAELELEQAREAFEDRTILAPFDGILGIPQVELGERISETTPVTSLDDRSVIIVEFDVPETYLKRLTRGQRITATTHGFRGQELEGEITQINSRIATATRSVRVRAMLRNVDDQRRAGMSFNVSITLEGAAYPTIPELALLWERDGAYIWRINQEGKAERVTVALVKRVQGRILVDGDLAAGQLVVVEGTQRLRPGREVSFDDPGTAGQGKAGL